MDFVKKLERKTLVTLASTVIVITVFTTSTAVWFMYNAAISQEKKLLQSSVKTHTALLNTIIEQDIKTQGNREQVIKQVTRLLRDSYKKFGSMHEYVVAVKQGDEIEFLFTSDNIVPANVHMEKSLTAEPMRRALRGEEGVFFAHDYIDRKVLAAYEPLIFTPQLKIGFVKKINLNKFRTSFLTAAALGMLITIVLVVVGIVIVKKVISPILGHLRERTQQLQVENAKRKRTENQLQKLINSVPVAIIVSDNEGRIFDVNATATKLFLYSKADMTQMFLQELLCTKTGKIEFDNLADSANMFSEPILGVKKDQQTFSTEVIMGEMYTDKELFAVVIRDLSVREQIEITQRKMLAAEEANKAKSTFISNISHELRTPLNGILGTLEILAGTSLDSYQEKFVFMANRAADNLLAVIGDILDFSKIEAGKLEINEHPFTFCSILESIAALGKIAHKKGVELICRVAPEVPEVVMGDFVRLNQILINLVGNAIKFTDKGEIILCISCVGDGDRANSREIQFRVQDSGIGISQEKQQEIFSAFIQADSSTTRKYGGTGLGLSIAAELVHMMGGEIGLESIEGQGSIFSFTIEMQVPQDKNTPSKPLEHLRVLVVDDHETNRIILEEIFKSWQMEVMVACDAMQAIEMMRACMDKRVYFDLLVTDYQMPGMDGEEMLREMRDNSLINETKVIVLTSSEPIRDKNLCDACLEKPIIRSHLLHTIQKVMGWGSVKKKKQNNTSGRRLNILLVEDSEINQTIAIDYLESAGHNVTVAGDGAKALAFLETQEFDAVLMDVQMPKMNGIEATQHIRTNEKYAELIIIAMTAHAMEDDRQRCLDAGMNDYLTKPIRLGKLLTMLNKYFPATSKDHVFNVENAMVTVDGSEELLNRIIDMFYKKKVSLLEELKNAIDSGDCDTVALIIHKMQGTLSNFGADSCLKTLERLGKSIKKQDFTEAKVIFHELSLKMDELQTVLKKWQKEKR